MLTVVPTPIGNLRDITLRALDELREADVIAAEDTRHTGHLLRHFEIRTPMVSLHDHNEAARTVELVERIEAGARVALVSDAGTPLVSDPGFRLVRACRERGLAVTVLPGACAVVVAVVGSGLPCDVWRFGGFLPVKSGRRRSEIERAVASGETSAYYESPFRLVRSLEVLAEVAPGARVCVARELTKQFEEFRVGAPGEVLEHFLAHPPKGEIVLVIHPAP